MSRESIKISCYNSRGGKKEGKERKEMRLSVLQELLRSLMKQADDVLLAPSSSLRIFSGLFFKEFLSRESSSSSSSSSTTQKSIIHSRGSEVCNCRSRLRTLSFMAAAAGEEEWKLPPHPKIPKGKKVTIIILDGWGENIPDRFNAIAVAETPAMDHLKTVMNIFTETHDVKLELPDSLVSSILLFPIACF